MSEIEELINSIEEARLKIMEDFMIPKEFFIHSDRESALRTSERWTKHRINQ